MPTINTTPEQHRWLQSLVNAQAQKETPSNTTNQGESSIAQSTLMALHTLNTGDTVSSLPRLDQVLDPTADKTFAMGSNLLSFSSSSGPIIQMLGGSPNLTLSSLTDLGAGYESKFVLGHHDVDLTPHTDWEIANNDPGNANYEFSLTDSISGTYKLFIKSGTTGDMYLQQSGGNVGIGVDPAGSPAAKLEVNGSVKIGGDLGFFATTPTTKKTVTGSKGANAALTSLIAALVAYGLITDTTS